MLANHLMCCDKKINTSLIKPNKIVTLRQSVNYYLTVTDDKKTIISNTSNSFRNMYYGGTTIKIDLQTLKDEKIISNQNTISHNFTLIKNHKSKEIWAVAGCGKRTKKKKPFTEGIYLLYSKNNMKSWKIFDNIIFAKNTKGWNPRGDSTFDSNISCFYSDILKQFVLITRYNIGAGSRGFQVFKSNHFKRGWDKGRLCTIDTYNKKENYYMNKVIEIPEYNLFVMVAPFSDLNNKNKKKSGLKILLSKNLINWFDCGLIKEASVVEKHSSTPEIQPVDLFFKNDKLEIWYHNNYFTKEKSIIYKVEVDFTNFIGFMCNNKKFSTKLNIKSHKIKINCEKTNNSIVEIIHNSKAYTMNNEGIIHLPDSINIGSIENIQWSLQNIMIYGFKFI